MTKLRAWKMAGTILLLCSTTAPVAMGQAFSTVVSFDGANGANPQYMALVQGPDGNLYGTTQNGGSHFWGTVFRITRAGDLTTVYNFCSQPNCTDGAGPYTGLTLGADGNFYGTTFFGGVSVNCCGAVFKITPRGDLTTLYSFCSQAACADGYQPYARLVQATDGSFYGTTYRGGLYGDGTVFKITTGGTFTTLHSFDGADGRYPYAGLIQATDGNLYGTTAQLGEANGNGSGTVFRITPRGILTTLHTFNGGANDGNGPLSGLVQATDGNLYGTATQGGICFYNVVGCGVVFRITLGGTLTTLYSFCSQIGCADGAFPTAGLAQGSDGNFYGTTLYGGGFGCSSSDGCGTAFEITPDGVLTTLHTFCSPTDCPEGYFIYGAVLQATNGTFYGSTQRGGAYDDGTVFSLNMGLGPFVTFVRPAGRVGKSGGILGQSFTGTTSVSFNGTAANFTVISNTLIKATVPAGATTGYVTVTTPSGTLTSNVPFHVLP